MDQNDKNVSLMANLRPRIMANKCAYIKRTLHGSGTITITKNAEVQPHDILGRSRLSSGYSAINLAKMLKVSPKSVSQYLQKKMGTTIYKGELLAFKKSLFGKKYITSPTDGVLEELDEKTGELRLKFMPREVPLASGVFGVVHDVDKDAGEVTIKTIVTEIYGVFGFGKQRSGILQLLNSPNNIARSTQLDPHMNGHVLMAGSLISMETLHKAASFGVQAVITGGMNFKEYNSVPGSFNLTSRLDSDVGITVVSTEGFGPLPIGEDIHEVLKQYDGRYIFANGNIHKLLLPSGDQDSILALRKIVLPETKSADLPPQVVASELRVGSKVRIIWPPLMGSEGVILGIDKNATVLESGISTYMVAIETSKQKIKVPFPNIELI